jgi:sugar O-acyltransferase (sialic acid O-acetyltransferase NeuD family)
MKGLLLLGGGGHCRAAIDVIEAEGYFEVKGIVQSKACDTAPVLGYPVIGTDDDLPVLLVKTPQALVTVGQIKTPEIRLRLFEQLKREGARMPVIVSPTAYISRHASIEEGTLIMHGAIVNAGALVGVNCIINNLALVDHDAKIGNHCHISTGSRVNGGVIIDDGCFIGSGAILMEGVRIGFHSVIGAGCIVANDISPKTLLKNQR